MMLLSSLAPLSLWIRVVGGSMNKKDNGSAPRVTSMISYFMPLLFVILLR
ncbi:hypothetical protein [Candidatus Ichthyocystis sparus]|nr:hypothetical protein [Candidatus Ichthyocystis sparus]